MAAEVVYPGAGAVKKAVAVIRAGGVIVFPTRSLYGLGADGMNPEAVARIYRLKGRMPEKPLPLLVASLAQAETLIAPPPAASRLMQHFWPGRLTLVMVAAPGCPVHLTAGSGKIGIRQAGQPVAAAIAAALGAPLTATSANRSGRPGCRRIDDLDPHLREEVDLVIDGGRLKGNRPSSVVDVSVDPPVMLREGAVSEATLRAALQMTDAAGPPS